VNTLLDIVTHPVTPYVLAWVAGVVFLAIFLRTQWFRHAWGRHVLAFMLVLEVRLGEPLAVWWIGHPYPGRRYVLAVLGWAFAAVMVQRAWVQWSLTRQARKGEGS
jgi:hypothetical protein